MYSNLGCCTCDRFFKYKTQTAETHENEDNVIGNYTDQVSVRDCCVLCTKTKRCVHYTFKKNQNECVLFKMITQKEASEAVPTENDYEWKSGTLQKNCVKRTEMILIVMKISF